MINKIIDKKEVFSMKMVKKHLILFIMVVVCVILLNQVILMKYGIKG